MVTFLEGKPIVKNSILLRTRGGGLSAPRRRPGAAAGRYRIYVCSVQFSTALGRQWTPQPLVKPMATDASFAWRAARA
jgi:hypothetical protein